MSQGQSPPSGRCAATFPHWGKDKRCENDMANEIARRLRKTMTPQEVKLWVHLRASKDQGLHFRRQVPREGYIVDFACLKSKIVIEVDGAQHGEPGLSDKDAERDARLSAGGFKVLRFWNNEVNESLDAVVETIYREAVARDPTRQLR
jgi:very-short-patch-repair endonuclease